MHIKDVRNLFPVFDNRNYLATGATSPANKRSLESIHEHLDKLANDPNYYYKNKKDDLYSVKELLSSLLHCSPDEVAVTDSTTTAGNIAVDLIEPNPGCNVVFDEFTYPSSIYPWYLPPHNKVEARFVKNRDGLIHLNDLKKAVDDNTIAVSICHVSPFEGFRHNISRIAEIAHHHGAVLIVDGAQGAGALDLNLHESHVDFYACCAMKWLLGASGLGFLYVSKNHLHRIPSRAGYIAGGFDIKNFDLVKNASRFEMGLPNLMGLAYTKPGLEILLEIGMGNIEKYVLELSGRVISGFKDRGFNVVTPEDPVHRSGIIAVHMKNAQELCRELNDNGIDIYSNHITLPYYKGDFIQISPHIYNDLDDIVRLFNIIDSCYRRH